MKRLIVCLVLATLAACGSTEPGDEFKGGYTLETINGQAIPYTWTAGTVRTTLTYGLFVLTPQGTWSLAQDGSQTVSGTSTSLFPQLVQGTWSASGSTLTFVLAETSSQFTATVSGNALTYSDGTNSYVYRR